MGLAIGNGIGPHAITPPREASGVYEVPFLVVSGRTEVSAGLKVPLGRHPYLKAT